MIRPGRFHLLISVGTVLLSLYLLFSVAVFADDTPTPSPSPAAKSGQISDLQKKIDELSKKVSELQGQSNTLASQIGAMDGQIRLTQLKMSATQQEITQLTADIAIATTKVSRLEESLNDITKVLLNRIVKTYETGKVQPMQLLLSSSNVSELMARSGYLRIAQEHDKKLVFETQQARNDYQNQKNLFEQQKKKVEALKSQLEAYNTQLQQEKLAKQALLDATKSDEKKYQSLLASARSEYEAIQGIVAGNGDETQVATVAQGDKIAEIIPGASCNSGGAHLHFIVSRDGTTQSPFSYLKPVDYENCSGSSCGSSDGDPFNPSGSWDWPISPKIKMSQGYGSTWAVRYSWVGKIYNFHNGIDIVSDSLDVHAVQPGTLYRGSYGGSGGCRLRYVRVRHNDGLDTFYLHINYVL